MINIVRTNAADIHFVELVIHLDKELSKMNGEEHTFFSQYNKLDAIRHAVVAYDDGQPVACGAMKQYDPKTMEIKRMYTAPEMRGKKIAAEIVNALENWALELGYEKCILETGKRFPSAIKLYSRQGYKQIANYGQYVNSVNSVCFEKNLVET